MCRSARHASSGVVTPAIREFLDRLQAVLDATERPRLDRERIVLATTDDVARVVLPHRDPERSGIELEVHDRHVIVTWPPERQFVHGYDDAYTLIEALLDGRMELVISQHVVYRKMRSYLDGRLLLTTRMPALTFRTGTERRQFGFG